MSAQDINPVIDILLDKVRTSEKVDVETEIIAEAALDLLRITLLNIDRIADALEWLADTQAMRRDAGR